MQEWIFAMLVISILLIFRDMAKTIFSGKKHHEEGFIPYFENHPEKERVEKYADSFQKLADSFYGMPYRKECLSSRQLEDILKYVQEQLCEYCFQYGKCWGEMESEMKLQAGEMIRSLETGNEERTKKLRSEWSEVCVRSYSFSEMLFEAYQKEKQNLIWNNKMVENRQAFAQQLQDMSVLLKNMAENLYAIIPADSTLTEMLKKKLRKHQILLKNMWVVEKNEGKRKYFLTLRAAKGQCISVLEAAQILSECCHCRMTSINGSRCMINGEFHTFHFVEEVSYHVIYGSARMTREAESVSGDNFSCYEDDDGRFAMCLADGMGSGVNACRESEKVIELLEQFLESGFSEETSVRIVNSALVLNETDGMFSTVDLCSIDLYTGICRFLKAGAAATFIRRDRWVEAIASESLAAGILQQADFETTVRKLYPGDYLFMMTDGVLDALPMERQEEIMKEIILDVKEASPKDMGREILERALGYSAYCARDDMTVLVAVLWKR